MSNGPGLYEVKCPNCGAPLPMSGQRVTCGYCGSVIERSQPDPPNAAPPRPPSQPQVVVIQSEYTAAATTRRKSGGCSCLWLLLVLLILSGGLGGLAWFRFPELTGQMLANFNLAEVSTRLANSVTISQVNRLFLLPGDHDGPPDLVTFAYPLSSGGNPVLVYKDALSSAVRWQSPQPIKEWYAAKVVASPGLIYTNDETKLLALNRADGTLAWQAPLADKLVSSCINCFAWLGERVIALVQGGTVQAFEAQSGQERWRKRLNFESTSRIETLGERLLIFDRTPDNRQNLMLVTNPAAGEVVHEVTIPDCQGEGFDLFNPLAFNPNRPELYFMAGDIIGPACLQVWDTQSWQMSRQVVFDGVALPSNFSDFVSEQAKLILLEGWLYFSGVQKTGGGDENVIVQVNPADEQWTVAARSKEYQLTALAVVGDTLLVRATRQRGTARDELWGVDPATGQPRWQYVLQAQRWYKDSGAGPVWDWQLTPHGLAVLQISEEPDQLALDVLDPRSGVSTGQNTIPLSDAYLTDIAWTPNTVWLVVRQIYAVDLKSRSLISTWP